jgi:hypothetical protein
MNGVIRIEFQIVDGNLKLMVHGPMGNENEKGITIQVLAQAIPIVLNYQPSLLIKPNGNGIPPKMPQPPQAN